MGRAAFERSLGAVSLASSGKVTARPRKSASASRDRALTGDGEFAATETEPAALHETSARDRERRAAPPHRPHAKITPDRPPQPPPLFHPPPSPSPPPHRHATR